MAVKNISAIICKGMYVTPLPSSIPTGSHGWTPTLHLECSGYIHSPALSPTYPDASKCNTRKLHNYQFLLLLLLL
jgi:hypothetical protein